MRDVLYVATIVADPCSGGYFLLNCYCSAYCPLVRWGALDATDLCPHSTAHDRFQAWVQAGVFLKLWQAGVEEFDELKGLDWGWLSRDGALTKAPLGGEKNRPQSHGSRQKGRQA